MRVAALLAVVFGLYATIRLIATAGTWISGNRFRAYRAIANTYGGRLERRGFSDPPTVSFQYNGSFVRVGLAPQVTGQTNNPRTRVVVRFPQGVPFRLELAPAGRPALPQAPRGTRPISVGDSAFDFGYSVQSNDPDTAREFLQPGVRWSIENLHRLSPPNGMLISVNPERLLVQVDRNLGSSTDALMYTVREALQIHDGLKRAVTSQWSQGVSIVAVGPASVEDAGLPVCGVCGDQIVAPEVICKTCRTPHHRDCWEFVGACSIYGCNGKQSLPA